MPVFLPGEFQGQFQAAYQVTVHGGAKSWTRLIDFDVVTHSLNIILELERVLGMICFLVIAFSSMCPSAFLHSLLKHSISKYLFSFSPC